MRCLSRVLALMGLLLPALAGCGSSASPPLTLSCKVQRNPPGSIRATITITNTTGSARPGIVYGPALSWLQHIEPVLSSAEVVVVLPHSRQPFLGYLIPTVDPKHPAHLIMGFALPPGPRSLGVTDRRTVHAADRSVLQNPACTIKRQP